MTPKQRQLLDAIVASGGGFIHAGDVRVARGLEKLGLIKLDDNGSMRGVDGRSDRERWMTTPTALAATYRSPWEQIQSGRSKILLDGEPAKVVHRSEGGYWIHVQTDHSCGAIALGRAEVDKRVSFP